LTPDNLIGQSEKEWISGFAGEELPDDVAHEDAPSYCFGQLGRGCRNGAETLANIGVHGFDANTCRMGEREQEPAGCSASDA
jgi:hypothetical protein